MYTVVVDESGDTGVRNVEPDPSRGPSQYFCMCAVIFNERNRTKIETALAQFQDKKGIVHAKTMGHFKKVHMCRTVAKLPIAMVGVCSNKLTLLDYLNEVQKTPTHYYNKVAQYLFERIGDTVGKYNVSKSQLRVHIEAREQKYSSLISFLKAIQNNPLDERSLPIRNLDALSISAVKKKDDVCLALADIGAHALFCALRKDEETFSVNETRYLRELTPVFMASRAGKVVPKGLKPIHSIKDLKTDLSTARELGSLKNPRKSYSKL